LGSQLRLQKQQAQASKSKIEQEKVIAELKIKELEQGLDLQNRTRTFSFVGIVLLGLLGMGLLFYNRQLSRKNKELSNKNRDIEEALYKGQTFERKRVAIELHDNISSLLSAAKISIEVLNPKNMSVHEQKVYHNILQLMDDACKEVRYISHNMIPPELENNGLAQVLENLIDKLNRLGTIKFNLDVSGLVPLTKVAAFNLYSICLELTNNIFKHAQATQAEIKFTKSNQELHLFVSDNGTGLTAQSLEGIGLRNISSRIEAMNGSMEKQSSATGTVFWFTIPLTETLVLS
jgi:signal transduction histidine kinase